MFANMIQKKIILASQSPRRKYLLEDMGFEFEVLVKDVDESFPSDIPIEQVAEYIANKKAAAFEEELTSENLIITADTVVIHENKILGKPKSFAEARTMIKGLSNGQHQVISGVCLSTHEKKISFSDLSEVFISEINETEMNYYIENYSPLDKAGAYGIQEWFGHAKVSKIVGSYTNIMGLPTAKLYEHLVNF